MRMLLFFFMLTIIFTKCTVQKPNDFIPKEFYYPASKIGTGKIFIYENSLTKQRRFESWQMLIINGKQFKINKSYDSSSISDSVIYLDDRVVEHYDFSLNKGGNPIKAENLQDTVINNGHRLGIHMEKIRYETEELINTATSRVEFLKDTTFTWQGNQLPSIITSGNSKIEIKVKADTSVSKAMEVYLKLYYAKGIGPIQYSIQFTDHTGKENYGLWKLVRIDDMKN
jgi:hypothetical protein